MKSECKVRPPHFAWRESSAIISDDGLYRYELRRGWLEGDKGIVAFCMLNPSTADERRDDPTIRRCIGFAKRWGFRGIIAVNLFAFRASEPNLLRKAADPIGPENDRYITRAARESNLFICAWGLHGALRERDREVLSRLLNTTKLCCLGTTAGGYPRHPLLLRYKTERVRFRWTTAKNMANN